MSLLQIFFLFILILTFSPGNHYLVAAAGNSPVNQLHQDHDPAEEKIVGGTSTEKGEFPYQVALTYDNKLFCGGAILDTHLILTAAHCVDKFYEHGLSTSIQVTAGLPDRKSHDQSHQQTSNAIYIHMHEKYDNVTLMNDIAIIMLDSDFPLHYNPLVRNISLQKPKVAFRGYARVSGLIRTRLRGKRFPVLKKVNVPIMHTDRCKRLYWDSKYPVTSKHICAGANMTHTCKEYGGSPAICRQSGGELGPLSGNNSEWTLCGILSFGRGCGRSESPNVYTRVSSHIDWIESAKHKIATLGKCQTSHFYCSSGTGCIPREFLCNNESDCPGPQGDEDEQRCTNLLSCEGDQFRCTNGQCLNKTVVCDGYLDCLDGADEEKCPNQYSTCVVGQHQCGVQGRCIPETWKCDKELDCDDGSDEVNCPAQVTETANGPVNQQDQGYNSSQVERTIVGGTFAEEGEFPYQVVLTRNNRLVCGGAILDTHLILTAAHCVEDFYETGQSTSIQVTAGKLNRKSTDPENLQIHNPIIYIHMHENYDNETLMNDIAIIALNPDFPLRYNAFVRSISLPKRNEAFGGYATVSGWGKTGIGEKYSRLLKKTTVPIMETERCKSLYWDSKHPVTSSHICAGANKKDTCQGDSGGPAICRGEPGPVTGNNSEWTLCGIVSFGHGCGQFKYPGVYTRVASYVDWIENAKHKIATLGKCQTSHFYCSSGTGCIPRQFLCDNESDCPGPEGDEDEQRCKNLLSCEGGEFRCTNGQCLDKSLVCNGYLDCLDGADEEKCPTGNSTCVAGQHQCGVKGRCIPETWKCDKERDCDDGSDEMNCPADPNDSENEISVVIPSSPQPCLDSQFRCDNGQCIFAAFRCDSENDCRDGSDEKDCHIREKTCGEFSWRCNNGQCIYHTFKCDGDFDCRDQSDEGDCGSH